MKRLFPALGLLAFALTPTLSLSFSDTDMRRSTNIEDRRALPPMAIIDDVQCEEPDKAGIMACYVFQKGYEQSVYSFDVKTNR